MEEEKTIQDILMARLSVTQEISGATAGHLRLTQAISGMEVLELGGEDTEIADLRAQLAASEEKIRALEQRMADLDRDLESLTRGETS